MAMDYPVESFNERVKHRNFYGIVPLLVFAKAKNVRHILRPRAVEEELVLATDDFAHSVGLRSSQLRMRRNFELPANFSSNLAIARLVCVDAILREGSVLTLGFGEQVHKMCALFFGQCLQSCAVSNKLKIMLLEITEHTAR